MGEPLFTVSNVGRAILASRFVESTFRKRRDDEPVVGTHSAASFKVLRMTSWLVQSAMWKDFKQDLNNAQRGKCAYCEVMIAADRYSGDVEHYRPKNRVDELTIVKSRRKQQTVWTSGYWWLAYEWRNYLLACGPCNSRFKRNCLPVENGLGGHLKSGHLWTPQTRPFRRPETGLSFIAQPPQIARSSSPSCASCAVRI